MADPSPQHARGRPGGTVHPSARGRPPPAPARLQSRSELEPEERHDRRKQLELRARGLRDSDSEGGRLPVVIP
jgi:hypothetical protein